MAVNTTDLSICNKALYFLKSDYRIATLDEDSLESRLCESFFDDALDVVTEQHEWNFAVERAILTASGVAPVFGYTYQFPLPTSPYCLKVLNVLDGSDYPIPDYKVVGRVIETDMDSVRLTYLKRITDLSESSPLFREALAYYLAVQLSEPLSRSTELTNNMEKLYNYAIKKAKKSDSQQGTYRPDPDYSWNDARHGFYSDRSDKNYRGRW